MISEKRRSRIEQIIKNRQHGLTVVLEDMYDPHNAAAVLRSCDAFGIQEVYFIFENQEKFNPRKVGKVSSASANKWLDFHIFTSTEECLTDLNKNGFTIYATILDDEAQSLYKTDFNEEKIALLFGNEHTGLTKKAVDLSHKKIYIPMEGFVQSFNLSVTASMFLYEVTRQRHESGTLQRISPMKQGKLLADFLER